MRTFKNYHQLKEEVGHEHEPDHDDGSVYTSHDDHLDSYIKHLSCNGWEGDDDYLAEATYITEKAPEVGTEEKRLSVVRPKLQKMHDIYGPADPHPASEHELKHRIESRFDELSAMHPKERDKEYKAANSRRKAIGIGPVMRGNEKTDTAANISTKSAPKGHIPLGMSMTPDTARHYTKPDASEHVSRNVCAGSTEGCRGACLAKHGNYEFATNKGHMDVLTQGLTHNANATRDHATQVHQTLHNASKKAAKEGKQVLTRYSVTDDTGAKLHSDATSKHFPHVAQMGYTKRVNTPNNPEKNVHSIYSDPGPAVHHTENGPVINHENLKRQSALRKATQTGENPKGAYMVFNRKRPRHAAGPDDPTRKEYEKHLNSLHTVRRYEENPSTPEHGEPAAHHNPAGHGRVISAAGQSHRYQDHPVADKVKDIHGNSLFPADHDARNVDKSSRTFHTPQGNKVGHVSPAFATASTSNKNLKSPFFHRVENIRDGIYHHNHPDELASAGHKPIEAPKVAAHTIFTHKGEPIKEETIYDVVKRILLG